VEEDACLVPLLDGGVHEVELRLQVEGAKDIHDVAEHVFDANAHGGQFPVQSTEARLPSYRVALHYCMQFVPPRAPMAQPAQPPAVTVSRPNPGAGMFGAPSLHPRFLPKPDDDNSMEEAHWPMTTTE